MDIDEPDFGRRSVGWRNGFRLRVGLRGELSDLPDTVLRLKMFQSLDVSAGSFPIYRQFRFAARRTLEELFDTIALHRGWAAQRLTESRLLLQAEGTLVLAEARRKMDYCSGKVEIWSDTAERAGQLRSDLLALVGEQLIRGQTFTIDWRFISKSEGLTSVTFEELADLELTDEAYPYLRQGFGGFVTSYLEAPETVLILQGPPGTGKTRLVRNILTEISRRKGDSANVLFASDRATLESDELSVDFLTGQHDAFFVEDADHLLGARSNGNTELHRFLTIADGVVRAQGRKIIFTTNLPNVGDIDEALLRPGRAFAVMQTRALSLPEAGRLLQRVLPGDVPRQLAASEQFARDGKHSVTLAEFYQALYRLGLSGRLRPDTD